MNQLTLQQLFGVNASQNSQTLIIKKSDLSLTPGFNHTAESLLVALLLKALENFQGIISLESYDSIVDDSNNFIIDENNDEISLFSDENEDLIDEFGDSIDFDNVDVYELLSVFLFSRYFSERNNYLFLTNQLVVYIYGQAD